MDSQPHTPRTPPILATPNSTITPLSSFNYKISVKLDATNYLVWLQQIEPVLRAHRLHRFCVTPEIPPQYASEHDRLANIENPAFSNWELQDQLLLAWLQSSLSPAILPSVIGCKHTFQLWENIHQSFQSKTKAQARQLRTQLRTTKKGSSSISEFLAKIKHISDSLTSIGESVSLQDQLDVILEGLPNEFESLVTLINSKIEWFDLEEIRALLLAHEQRLDKARITEEAASLNFTQSQPNSKTPNSVNPNSATETQIAPQANWTTGNSNSGNYDSQNNNFKNNNQSRGRGGRNGRGNRGGRGGRSTVQCQVCHRTGHDASYCYHRFNAAYGSNQPYVHGNPYQYVRNTTPNNNNWAQSNPQWQQAAPQANFTGYAPQTNFTGYAMHPTMNNNLDTAATQHVTLMQPPPGSAPPPSHLEHIFLGNGQGLRVTGISSYAFPSPSHPHHTLHLNNVLHVPSINKNLISVSKFASDNNAYIQFHPSHFVMKSQDNDQILLQGKLDKAGLYPIHSQSSTTSSLSSRHHSVHSIVTSHNDLYFQWHHRLGHTNLDTMNNVLKSCNMPTFNKNKTDFCISCCLGKSHRLPSQLSQSTYNSPLELIYCDLWGPAPMQSSMGYKYYISFIDAFSKYIWVYFLHDKSETLTIFKQFKALAELQLNTKIKAIQSDWGGEFRSFTSYLSQLGIIHRIICPHTHHQNGVVERKHRHIVEMGLSLLSHSSLPYHYWDHAFHTAVYIINRLPASHNHCIPLKVLFNNVPDYNFLRAFGCACYPLLTPYNNPKFQYRSKECIFLGYSTSHRGYKCLDNKSGRIYISKDVLFNEKHFPYQITPPTTCSPNQTVTSAAPLGVVNHIPLQTPHTPNNLTPNNQPTPHIPTTFPSHTSSPYISASASPTPTLPSTASSTIDPNSTPTSSPSPTTNTHHMLTRSKTGHLKPPLFPTINLTTTEPTTVQQALSSIHWTEAMQQEYQALQANKTWSLVPLPPHKRAIGCKWIFRIKENPDGTINKYKARLVAKGFNQKYGQDYSDTYSPVVKPITVRTVLTIALTSKWPLIQLDVNNAFLNGQLHEDVYMQQPQGFIQGESTLVCKLHKAIYGLKQSPRAWYESLTNTLISFGFQQSKCDPSLLIFNKHGCCLLILIYVDDIIITGSSNTAINLIVNKLNDTFSLKQLGTLEYFLGIECKLTPSGALHLSQAKYIRDILHRAGMEDCKGISTPLPANLKLSKTGADPFDNPTLYRSIVGALQYATITRPELGYSVSKVCQFFAQPLVSHWSAVKRILRYLKGSIDHGLTLLPATTSAPLSINAFCDADWASDIDDRRSTSGACIFFGPNLVSWWSKKQTLVAKSSAEAEYRSLAHAASEVLWLQSLLHELKVPIPPPVIYCDNQSAVAISHNPVLHSRTKHMELDIFFVREKVLNKSLVVSYIPAQLQVADILTKSLSKHLFYNFRSKLRVLSTAELVGGVLERSLKFS